MRAAPTRAPPWPSTSICPSTRPKRLAPDCRSHPPNQCQNPAFPTILPRRRGTIRPASDSWNHHDPQRQAAAPDPHPRAAAGWPLHPLAGALAGPAAAVAAVAPWRGAGHGHRHLLRAADPDRADSRLGRRRHRAARQPAGGHGQHAGDQPAHLRADLLPGLPGRQPHRRQAGAQRRGGDRPHHRGAGGRRARHRRAAVALAAPAGAGQAAHRGAGSVRRHRRAADLRAGVGRLVAVGALAPAAAPAAAS